jgi:hypothetical protein
MDAGGYAKAWAYGTAEPSTFSDVEYAPNSIRSNANTVPVGLDGAIEIHNVSGATVDFVIDVEGWYAGASSTLCNHDDITLSTVATTGTSDGVGGTPTVISTGSTTAYALPVAPSSADNLTAADDATATLEPHRSSSIRKPACSQQPLDHRQWRPRVWPSAVQRRSASV